MPKIRQKQCLDETCTTQPAYNNWKKSPNIFWEHTSNNNFHYQ